MLNPSVPASEFVTPEALCSYFHCLLPSQAHRYMQVCRALRIVLALLVLSHMRARRPGVELPMLTGAPNGLALVDVELVRHVRSAPALNCYRIDHRRFLLCNKPLYYFQQPTNLSRSVE